MKTVIKQCGWIFLWMCASIAWADTFKHKETGEVFTGFATQKSTGGKTLVFNKEANKMTPVNLYEYQVTYDTQGRRDSVVLIPLMEPEILLSQTVAEEIANAVINASNTGPQAILIQIDNPGGRGDYMSIIATALSKTTNCPTAAYISAGSYGGAFSSAAVLALACQKIYIAPNAGIGAVSPIAGSAGGIQDFGGYLTMYNSADLLPLSLAQQHRRPELLARALADKSVSVVEVTNINGSREFVQKNDRQPTQTVVRTLAEGIPTANTSKLTPADVMGVVLNLTAKDAVNVGLADKIAGSVAEILTDMKIPDVKVTSAGGIDNLLKKFRAARRNIAQSLATIERIEEQSKILDDQFYELDKQLRTGMLTREVTQGAGGIYQRRSDERTPLNYSRSFTDETTGVTQSSRNLPRRLGSPGAESITTVEPAVNIEVVRGQLINVLRDLVAEYRKVINLAERWPGGLPADLPLETLQKNMDLASAQLDNLYRYQPIYQYQVPQQPIRRPIR